MRAIVMVEPSASSDRTEVREVDVPRPGNGEVSIDVASAGINFLDIMARRGDPGYASSWPYVPGLEVAGTIRETGPGVPHLKVGQKVAALTVHGGLAEVALASAELTVPVPEPVPLEVAASAPAALATAWLLLCDVARLAAGESVLMHSASGGIGSAIAQLVPILGGGLRIGTVGGAAKLAATYALGYDVAVVRTDDLVSTVRANLPDGVDVVLDPLGTTMLDADLAVLAPRGRVVLFGNAGGEQAGALPSLGQLIGGNVTVSGFSLRRLSATAPRRVSAALRQVLDLLADGRLTMPASETGTLQEVPAIHQLLADGRGRGKYIISLQIQ